MGKKESRQPQQQQEVIDTDTEESARRIKLAKKRRLANANGRGWITGLPPIETFETEDD
jgi:hypothetical protein